MTTHATGSNTGIDTTAVGGELTETLRQAGYQIDEDGYAELWLYDQCAKTIADHTI